MRARASLSHAKFYARMSRAAAALFRAACACCFMSAAAAENNALTYHSPEVGCDWLAAEYRTIKSHSDPDRPRPPAVTKEGVMMTFGMILSLPSILFGEAAGGGGPRYDFSRDVADLAAAAAAKKCAALLQLMEKDRRAGDYPPPPSAQQTDR